MDPKNRDYLKVLGIDEKKNIHNQGLYAIIDNDAEMKKQEALDLE